MKINFHPKLLDCLPTYTKAQFGKDLASGITVGVLALPLAMAFAIASGCSPAAGIWTAIIAGLITSLFGGSRVQIGGPTGAFTQAVTQPVGRYLALQQVHRGPGAGTRDRDRLRWQRRHPERPQSSQVLPQQRQVGRCRSSIGEARHPFGDEPVQRRFT